MIYTRSISPRSSSCSNLAELGGPDAHSTRLQVLKTSSKDSKTVWVDESAQVSDREALSSNPGPPTNLVLKIGVS